MWASKVSIAWYLPVILCPLLAWSCAAPRGEFVRSFCHSDGSNRFRVNSPDTATGRYRDRWEAKQTGEMKLVVDEDLSNVREAELYLELWGGHPGVANKRFSLNGQSTYALPEVGAADENCTYSYPAVPVKIDELVQGTNTIQFACEKGKTFWGHFLIRAACIRLHLDDERAMLRRAGLGAFEASVTAHDAPGETILLELQCDPAWLDRIASVEFRGRYRAYDENGDGSNDDWHGFTKDLEPVGVIAVVDEAPFEATWDLSMIPVPSDLAVRAVVRFENLPDVAYVTHATEHLPVPERRATVRLVYSNDLPRPFWSRADRVKSCTIVLDDDPTRIERAQLHINVWDGGKGTVGEPLTINGHALKTADWQGRHDLIYTVVELEPAILKKGANRLAIRSDTEHHGIEVCLPGPALIVRSTQPESKARESR